MIMTRLLMPEMFGIMSLVTVFIFGLSMMSDLGLRQVLIQNKRSDKDFINTVWSAQILRGALIWLCAILLAVGLYFANHLHLLPANSVYAEPILPWVLAVLGISTVIIGFESINLLGLTRNLNMRTNVVVDLISQVFGMAMMMLWAHFDRSIWALVTGYLSSNICKLVLSFVMTRHIGHKHEFILEKAAVHDIIHFGKWIFLTSILGFLASSGDRLVLGGLLDTKQMGLYSIAFFIVAAIRELISRVTNVIGFSALSEVYRTRPQDLKSVYYKFRFPVDLLTLFLVGFLFTCGDLIIKVLYDKRYAEAGLILQILSVGIFELRYRLASDCYLAMGKPKLLAPVIFVQILVTLFVVPFVYHHYGFQYALWAIAMAAFPGIPLNYYYHIKYHLIDWKKELIVLPMLLVGYGAGLIVHKLYELIIVRFT